MLYMCAIVLSNQDIWYHVPDRSYGVKVIQSSSWSYSWVSCRAIVPSDNLRYLKYHEISLSMLIWSSSVSRLVNLKYRIYENSLAAIFSTQSDDIRDITHKSLLGFRTNKSVFVVRIEYFAIDSLPPLILYKDELYSFDPFPDIRITKLEVNDYFPMRATASYNLKGYFLNAS